MLKKNFCLIPLLVRMKLVLIGLIKPFRLIYLLTTFRLFVDLIDTMFGAREVLSLFEETIGKMSSNEDWWKV